MPEYLSPGVYVEEVSFRAKSIEGVATSTTGYAGVTRYGPVQYVGGPASTAPRLVTSFTEFERVYGGLDLLEFPSDPGRTAYLPHAVRAFFNNGGQRLYVSRVFSSAAGADVASTCVAGVAVPLTQGTAAWHARWPGADGNVLVDAQVVRGKNIAFTWVADPDDPLNRASWGIQARSLRNGAVVELTTGGGTPPIGNAALDATKLCVVQVDVDGKQTFWGQGPTNPVAIAPGTQIALVEMKVLVYGADGRIDAAQQLALDPSQRRWIGKVLESDDPEDEDALVWLEVAPSGQANNFDAAALAVGLQNAPKRLVGGTDGDLPSADMMQGAEADLDDPAVRATGLEALGEIDDIAIVALPDAGAMDGDDEIFAAAQALVGHAEKYRYRIAVVDAKRNSSITEIREFRGQFDTEYAALYHPWIEILDPLYPAVPGVPPRKLLLPPSGFVTGIYARSDINRGVQKAPANEVVMGLTRFEANINKARQDVLNPEGVNCLRFFEGRGNLVWGARTMSSDPEWTYVNVRRLFIFMEHSIDKATQWAVFEPNNERLWANIRTSVQDFLYTLWRDGALIGAKPEQAYFVRCDRTTMTQNDLDNGRMICLVGVAPVRPAEFVIFRIGQWTADSQS